MTRFEPATSGSTDRRSNQLSYIHHKSVLYYTNLTAFLQKHSQQPKGHSTSLTKVYLCSRLMRRTFSLKNRASPPRAVSR